jgi:uncharacterized protein YraI
VLDGLVGRVLEGKYVILQKLQETETTALFAGRHTRLDLGVRIKVFKPEHIWPAGDPRALLRLKDRHIWSSDRAAELTFRGQVLRYVLAQGPHGRPLREDLLNGDLAPEHLDRILGQVSHALYAAREQGFVHEGLDSSKVWIDEQGNAHLLGFDFVPVVRPRFRWLPYAISALAVLIVALWLVLQRVSLLFLSPEQAARSLTEPATLIEAPMVVPTLHPTPAATVTPTILTSLRAGVSIAPIVTATTAQTPTPVRTPLAWSSRRKLKIYTAPGPSSIVWAEIDSGVQVVLHGCTRDGLWWQVEHINREGWVPARSAVSNLSTPCARVSVVAPTPIPTVSPSPTATKNPSPTPARIPRLANATFEGIEPDYVPGWRWWAVDNCLENTKCPPDSFDTPHYKQADEQKREIRGPTLQIDATPFALLHAGLFQIVPASPGMVLRATVQARAFSDLGTIRVRIGIDPSGRPGCEQARYGPHRDINEGDDIVDLTTPEMAAGTTGQVTVCLSAESSHPAHSSAAFFDNAALVVSLR